MVISLSFHDVEGRSGGSHYSRALAVAESLSQKNLTSISTLVYIGTALYYSSPAEVDVSIPG